MLKDAGTETPARLQRRRTKTLRRGSFAHASSLCVVTPASSRRHRAHRARSPANRRACTTQKPRCEPLPGQYARAQLVGTCESQTSGGHENRSDDQHAPPPDTVCSSCEVKRDDDITDEGQRKNQASLG